MIRAEATQAGAAVAAGMRVDPGKPVEPARALTAVRGLAAWWVVAYHFRDALPAHAPASVMRTLDRGYLAVDLFFVLSGYVIALNYARLFEAGGGTLASWRRFLLLRLSRIYPLHLCILLLFLVDPLAISLFSTQGLPADLHVRYYLLSLLLAQAWGTEAGPTWNVPAWSISAEWLAYILFPGLALLAARVARRPAHALAAVAALASGLAATTAALGFGDLGAEPLGLVRCGVEFSMGVCLWRLERGRVRSRGEARAGLLAAGLCGLVFAAGAAPDYAVLPLGFAALVYALADERGRVAAVLRAPALQWLGVVSYSTYMSHYLLKTWVKFVLVSPGGASAAAFPVYVAAVLAASALLHAGVERPCQRRLRAWLAGAAI